MRAVQACLRRPSWDLCGCSGLVRTGGPGAVAAPVAPLARACVRVSVLLVVDVPVFR